MFCESTAVLLIVSKQKRTEQKKYCKVGMHYEPIWLKVWNESRYY